MVKRHMSDDYRDEFFADYRKTLKYKKLSTKEELDFIKKTKLSFYDDVPSEEKDKYLEYYMEMFPKFKEEYLNNPDEKLLDLAIENSKNWRDRFLENNQAMVLKIAFGYLKNCHFLSIVDLISEGNIGMLIALRKFDVEMGNRFSTYAALWIKRYIGDVILRDDKTIRMSNHQQANLAKLNRVERQLYFSLERVPTIEELAEHSGLSIKQVETLREYYVNKRIPESLDMPFTEEADETIGDFVVSLEEDFTNQVENNILFSKCLEYLKKELSPDHIEVLFKRYGFEDGVSYSYARIAEQMGMEPYHVKKLDDDNIKVLRRRLNTNKYGK